MLIRECGTGHGPMGTLLYVVVWLKMLRVFQSSMQMRMDPLLHMHCENI